MPGHNWFEAGQWNAQCDQCGRIFKSGLLTRRWDMAMVCESCFETRHPQDYVRGVKEDMNVPWSRPWEPKFTP